MSLADACHRIETNEPPIKYASIVFYNWGTRLNSGANFHLGNHEYNDAAGWRRLGRAIGNNSTIHHLSINVWLSDASFQPAATCHREFYNELKHNTSIQMLMLNPVSDIVPSFDLGHFLRNNSNIKDLSLDGDVISDLDAAIISPAIESAQLRRFDVGPNIRFGNDGAFQQMTSACWGVENLSVISGTNSKYSVLAALLRDPRAILQRLVISEGAGISANFDRRLAMREIAASLVGNANLKELQFNLRSQAVVDEFDRLLCNTSSIVDICNSNHTLAKIHHSDLSARTRECLQLNQNETKNKVIRDKIMRYYFIGDCDLAPFFDVPVSVLAEVMGLGAVDKNKTAIFKLLRGIPNLCDVSSRTDKPNKRPKIGE
jgi:hypothetical protein